MPYLSSLLPCMSSFMRCWSSECLSRYLSPLLPCLPPSCLVWLSFCPVCLPYCLYLSSLLSLFFCLLYFLAVFHTAMSVFFTSISVFLTDTVYMSASLHFFFPRIPWSTEFTDCQALCPVVRIGSPLTRKRVLLPPLGPRGEPRLLERGPNPDEGTDTLVN